MQKINKRKRQKIISRLESFRICTLFSISFFWLDYFWLVKNKNSQPEILYQFAHDYEHSSHIVLRARKYEFNRSIRIYTRVPVTYFSIVKNWKKLQTTRENEKRGRDFVVVPDPRRINKINYYF